MLSNFIIVKRLINNMQASDDGCLWLFMNILSLSDKPDSPGTPNIKDVDKNLVELEWTAPIKDGGARITGYLVEKKRVGSDVWEPATADGLPVIGTSAKITEGLVEDADYEFRVRAVNAAGPGDPSIPSDLVKVAKKKGKEDL